MKDGGQIIIKKIKKRGHGGHHGGAWKVAYADFITAMMALFLVLWLVAMSSIETRQAVGKYFRSFSIFKGTQGGGGKGISATPGDVVKLDTESGGIKQEEVVISLHKAIDKDLNKMNDQILVYRTKEGVRIELVEKEGFPMFESGNATLLENGRKVLKVITEVLKWVNNDIIIEGHTDSYPYIKEDYSNWELSADRANAARRELIKNGLPQEKIKKIISFADSIPLNPDNPYDKINRRVTILLNYKPIEDIVSSPFSNIN